MITENRNSWQKRDFNQESAKFFYSGNILKWIHRAHSYATHLGGFQVESSWQITNSTHTHLNYNYKDGLQVNTTVPEPN